MPRIFFACHALAACLCLSAAEPPTDHDRLQGPWVMASLEINGEKVTEGHVATGKLVVEGNRYTPLYEGQTYHESFRLDPEKTPKSIDFTYTEGPRKGESVKGIYKFDGDKYVMCRAIREEDDRPKEFATKAESGLVLVVWKRENPAGDGKP